MPSEQRYTLIDALTTNSCSMCCSMQKLSELADVSRANLRSRIRLKATEWRMGFRAKSNAAKISASHRALRDDKHGIVQLASMLPILMTE